MADEKPPHAPTQCCQRQHGLSWADVLKDFRVLGRRAVAHPGTLTEEEIQEIAWALLVLSDNEEEVTEH